MRFAEVLGNVNKYHQMGQSPHAMSYDRAGRAVSVTDAAGTRALAYDAFGNSISETVPQAAGKTVSRTFDSLNRRTGLALGTDISATYAYDAFGRLSSISSGVDTIAFDYRAHGTALAGKRWLRNNAPVASATAQYDVWGNITNISFGAPGDLHSIGYIYDIANRRTQASLPDGTKWLYGYDRLSQVTSGERVDAQDAPVAGQSFRYAYDGIGNRTTSQDGSNADLRNYTANSLNQYTSIFSPGIIPIRGKADADAKVAVTTTVGGVSTTYVPARSGQDFSIDIPVDNSQGAVTAAVQVDALRHDGTLDVDLHRRLSGDYTVPAATPQVPTYDADGNLLTCDGWSYTWNAQNRLVAATKGTTRLEFNYDYLGRRFEKKVYENNTLTKHQLFVYDGFKQIAEYDALNSNALANTYIWQPVGLDVPLLRNGEEFFVSDANKNIVALIDTTGSVTDTYVYDPFGSCTHLGISTNPFRFSSESFDEETELVYYNFRYYSPTNGKWLSRDKIDELDTVNLYVFAHNNSVCFMDSLGTVSLLSPPAEITECLIRFLYSTAVKNYIGTSVSDATITDFIRRICISEGCLPTSSNFMEHINEYYASSLIVDAINAAKDCISRIPGIGKSVSLTIKTEKIKSPRFWCDKKECSVRYHFKLQTKVYVKIPLLRKTFSWELDTIDITKSAMIPFQVCCRGE